MRWYQDVCRGSATIGDVYLRWLGFFCQKVGKDPLQLTKMKDMPLVNLITDFVSKMIINHTGSCYLHNFKSIRVNDKEGKDVFGFSLSCSQNSGQRFLRINNEYPVLPSSMLTGQRALDLGSRERLIWHIDQALGGSLR